MALLQYQKVPQINALPDPLLLSPRCRLTMLIVPTLMLLQILCFNQTSLCCRDCLQYYLLPELPN